MLTNKTIRYENKPKSPARSPTFVSTHQTPHEPLELKVGLEGSLGYLLG